MAGDPNMLLAKVGIEVIQTGEQMSYRCALFLFWGLIWTIRGDIKYISRSL